MYIQTLPAVRLTDQARERAAERAILTKAVKRTLADPSVTYPSRDKRIAKSDQHPGVSVVYVDEHEVRVAITTFWTHRSAQRRHRRARASRPPVQMVARPA